MYFFIDNQFRLFYTQKWVQIDVALKTSHSYDEVAKKLEIMNIKSIMISNVKINPIKPVQMSDLIEITNMRVFEINLEKQKYT